LDEDELPEIYDEGDDDAYREGHNDGRFSFNIGNPEPPYPNEGNGLVGEYDYGFYDGWHDARYEQERNQAQGVIGMAGGMKMTPNAMNGFKDDKGKLDDLAFRQYCLNLAQQSAKRGGVIAGVPQDPEPIGETIRRAQYIETYLKEGAEFNANSSGGAA
jgi:hypothetical protein